MPRAHARTTPLPAAPQESPRSSPPPADSALCGSADESLPLPALSPCLSHRLSAPRCPASPPCAPGGTPAPSHGSIRSFPAVVLRQDVRQASIGSRVRLLGLH